MPTSWKFSLTPSLPHLYFLQKKNTKKPKKLPPPPPLCCQLLYHITVSCPGSVSLTTLRPSGQGLHFSQLCPQLPALSTCFWMTCEGGRERAQLGTTLVPSLPRTEATSDSNVEAEAGPGPVVTRIIMWKAPQRKS